MQAAIVQKRHSVSGSFRLWIQRIVLIEIPTESYTCRADHTCRVTSWSKTDADKRSRRSGGRITPSAHQSSAGRRLDATGSGARLRSLQRSSRCLQCAGQAGRKKAGAVPTRLSYAETTHDAICVRPPYVRPPHFPSVGSSGMYQNQLGLEATLTELTLLTESKSLTEVAENAGHLLGHYSNDKLVLVW